MKSNNCHCAETLESQKIINTYQKEQLEYIQNQINKIRNLVEDRHGRQLMNRVAGRVHRQ